MNSIRRILISTTMIPLLWFCSNMAESHDQHDKLEQYQSECIEKASDIIINHNTKVDRTATFSTCLKAAPSQNPVVWYFIGYMQLNAIGAKANLDEGLQWLKKAGNAGVASAQKDLAQYYLTGGGVKPKIDMNQAIHWLSRLALNNHSESSTEASFRLCSIYLFGTGIDPDYERAYTWCKKSGIEQKNYDGLTNLALLLINGWGTNKNVPLALDYYTTAARNGVVSAQLSLGRAYSIGQDIPVDYNLAFKWMKAAADTGSPQGLYYLAQMYEFGQGVEQDEKLSREYYQQAAQLGEPRAQYALGRLYQYSSHGNIDYAAKWYHKAAAQGNTDAMIAIGDLYKKQNQKEMIRWYNAAAHLDNDDGKLRLIPYLISGTRDTKPDPQLALKYATQLARNGNSSGYYWIGQIYLNGYCGPKDLATAYEAFLAAIKEGNADAACELGKGILNHTFEQANPNDAEKYLLIAAENGCINDACLELGRLYVKQGNYEKAKYWLDNAESIITPQQQQDYFQLQQIVAQHLSK